MQYALFTVWLLPGIIMAYEIIGFFPVTMNETQAIAWYCGAYIVGGAITQICHEIGRLIDKIRASVLGTARFGSKADMRMAGLNAKQGVIVAKEHGRVIRFNKAGHLVTISKTRGGKGVSCVIPNLLDHKGSVFCVDIKGENHAITHRHRKQMSYVYNLAPFAHKSSCYNPLDFIRYGPDEIDDASLIATLMVVPGEHGADSFWDKEARALITGLILYVVRHRPKKEQTLSEIRRILTMNEESLNTELERMANSPHPWIKRAAAAFRALRV